MDDPVNKGKLTAPTYIQVAKMTLEIGLSTAIVILFLSFLMVGAAQSEVLKKIDAQNLGVEYGEVRAAAQTITAQEDGIKRLNLEVFNLRKELAEKEIRLKSKYRAWVETNYPPPEEPSATPIEIPEISTAFPEEYADIEVLILTVNARIDDRDRLRNLPTEANTKLLPLNKTLDGVALVFPSAQLCMIDFCPLDIPPSTLPFYLIFLSGLFGAVLFQIIVRVYPDNDLTRDHSGNFVYRIVLGGAIAVALFVLLASGSALLGSAENLANANRNIYSLSSIGVLAGMFSNRVAAWLSARADMFLSHQGNNASGNGGNSGQPG
ncbi:MAG: hypothetical protein AAF707_02675 [Pseudomonadota bacterium]